MPPLRMRRKPPTSVTTKGMKISRRQPARRPSGPKKMRCAGELFAGGPATGGVTDLIPAFASEVKFMIARSFQPEQRQSERLGLARRFRRNDSRCLRGE